MSSLRIVSLVPSISELIVSLGLAPYLVGRTGFCIHPASVMGQIVKVGGTKAVDINKIRLLAPTHVVVNVDENEKSTVDQLQQCALNMVITHPCAPVDNIALIDQLLSAFGPALAAEPEQWQAVLTFAADLKRHIHQRLGALQAAHAQSKPTNVLYLIWRDPWMTVAQDTYISQMLGMIGWRSLPCVHGGDGIHSPGAARYPVVRGDEPWLALVQRVLLSSEPYSFKSQHLAQVQAWLPHTKVQLVDGEMLSWYGSRAVQGLDYLAALSAAAVAEDALAADAASTMGAGSASTTPA